MDIQERLLKYAEYYACYVHYFDGEEVVITFLTRNQRFYTPCDEYNFYDMYKRKNVLIKTALSFEVWFVPPNLNGYLLFNNMFKQTDLDSHFKNTLDCIEFIYKKTKQESQKLIKRWKTMSFYDLKEECYEKLFFEPKSQTTPELIKEMKDRQEYLNTTVDGGIISKVLAVMEIPEQELYLENTNIVESCKKKWKSVISFYAQKAKNQLDMELEDAKKTNDISVSDLTVEVTEIKKVLDDVTDEIDKMAFKTPNEIASFWPDLLKPSPIYVLKSCKN
jgi:hypothetical protein